MHRSPFYRLNLRSATRQRFLRAEAPKRGSQKFVRPVVPRFFSANKISVGLFDLLSSRSQPVSFTELAVNLRNPRMRGKRKSFETVYLSSCVACAVCRPCGSETPISGTSSLLLPAIPLAFQSILRAIVMVCYIVEYTTLA